MKTKSKRRCERCGATRARVVVITLAPGERWSGRLCSRCFGAVRRIVRGVPLAQGAT